MTRYEDKRMIMVATDYHEGLERPYQTWVDEWVVEPLVSGTLCVDDDKWTKLALAHLLVTKSGEKTRWYVKAGPHTLAEIEEWYATGTRNGVPFPPVR